MSTFEVKVYPAKILPHPDPETTRLELCQIGEYLSVVGKGQIKDGDRVAYIPEQSIVPANLLEEMGLTGRLAGGSKDRVKAVKLRGVVSQGLVHKVDYPIGTDIKDDLGIREYEPPIPAHMNGEVYNSRNKTIPYDIENIKKYPNVLKEGDSVIVTEKLHGTLCCMGFYEDEPIVTSKGLGKAGLALKHNEVNERNLYMRAFNDCRVSLDRIHRKYNIFYVFGEILGRGVQKGFDYGYNDHQIRIFDIFVGAYMHGRFLEYSEMRGELGSLEPVPIIYQGGYNEGVRKLKDGDSVMPQAGHMREGIVIKATPERMDDDPINGIGRVILKDVSDAYLTRKGGTEYQ